MTLTKSTVLLATSLFIATTARAGASWERSPCPLRAEYITSPVGRSERALRQAYGAPAGSQEFLLARGINVSRRSLRTLYPGSRFDHLPVRELGWVKRDCRLVIWFVQRGGIWTAVQALRSNAASEF